MNGMESRMCRLVLKTRRPFITLLRMEKYTSQVSLVICLYIKFRGSFSNKFIIYPHPCSKIYLCGCFENKVKTSIEEPDERLAHLSKRISRPALADLHLPCSFIISAQAPVHFGYKWPLGSVCTYFHAVNYRILWQRDAILSLNDTEILSQEWLNLNPSKRNKPFIEFDSKIAFLNLE